MALMRILLRPSYAVLLAAALVGLSCGPAADPELTRLEAMAESVTIIRDSYGVPHIYGPTDAAVVFGLAYARAEDQFQRIEEFYAESLGRLAELRGEEHLAYDLLVRSLELERHARAEYDRLTPELTTLCNAFADGLNYFLATHPNVRPRLFQRFEPWFPLAGELNFWSLYSLRNSAPSIGLQPEDILRRAAGTAPAPSPAGPRAMHSASGGMACNAFAIAPSRTASGNAMLLIDAHISLEAAYELQLHSDQGLQIAGFANYGYGVLPIAGFNRRLGWMITENAVDWVDLYAETFDDPHDPLAYRYGDEVRRAVEWTEVVRVASPAGVKERSATFRKTHHGPILAERDGRQIAVKVAGLAEGGVLNQLYAMARATNLEQFQRALELGALTNQHLVYADRAGNIYYVYNGLIPRRDPRFDWTAPVDGSDPATEWQGFHSLADRPQVLNPPSGFIQNCNSSPFVTTTGDNPEPRSFPPYMVSPRDTDHFRSQRARRLLENTAGFSLDTFAAIPNDTYLLAADDNLPRLFNAFQALPEAAEVRRLVAPAVHELAAWDRRSAVDSVAASLFIHWYGTILFEPPSTSTGEDPLVPALAAVMAGLEADWGSWRVPWGEINRLRRPPPPADAAQIDTDDVGLPIAGAPAWAGTVNAFYTIKPEGSKRRFGVAGRANTAVIEFGNPISARSVIPFGQSQDPQSPHYLDQATLYFAGELKPMWSSREELEGHIESAYHPGEERARAP
jgi:acyl-homoserine lactone acylase PvdQ